MCLLVSALAYPSVWVYQSASASQLEAASACRLDMAWASACRDPPSPLAAAGSVCAAVRAGVV